MLQLHKFRDLIANMPVPAHAFASKRSTWTPYMNPENDAGVALGTIFGTHDDVFLSRSDLRSLAPKPNMAEFVMATIIWGYPGGMRGNNIATLIGHFRPLIQLLSNAHTQSVPEWESHFEQVRPIEGVGLSTYTKFLYFLSVRVEGHLALILDKRIIDVSNRGVFEELAPLQDLNENNSVRKYPSYLALMDDIACQLSVHAENIEMFLFEFGLHLKTP